jgi:hypothetical protein
MKENKKKNGKTDYSFDVRLKQESPFSYMVDCFWTDDVEGQDLEQKIRKGWLSSLFRLVKVQHIHKMTESEAMSSPRLQQIMTLSRDTLHRQMMLRQMHKFEMTVVLDQDNAVFDRRSPSNYAWTSAEFRPGQSTVGVDVRFHSSVPRGNKYYQIAEITPEIQKSIK